MNMLDSLIKVAQNIKQFLSQGMRAQWCVFFLLLLTVVVKCLYFHWTCYQGFIITSLWTNPPVFWGFWLSKITPALFIASFVFICRHQWWAIVFSVIIDIWMYANIVYFRANGIMIDIFSITMIGNMHGFWSSVLFYCSVFDLLFPLCTCIFAIIVVLIPSSTSRNIRYTFVGIVVVYILSVVSLFMYSKRWGGAGKLYLNPCSRETRESISSANFTVNVKDFSIIHSLGFIVDEGLREIFVKEKIYDIALQRMTPFINNDIKTPSFHSPLIIILVESLENWSINDISTPYLSHFMQTHHCLHATHVTSQTRGGTSADGQMLINTGLLPINQGAACFRFPTNKYPSIGECCDGQSVTILPHKIGVWNQHYMSPAYAYDTTIVRGEEDSILFQTTIDCLHQGYQMIQTITMSSHSPFQFGASRSSLQVPSELPTYMADYVKSIHYMDAGLQVLLSQVDIDSLLTKATIVITGDHIIFPNDKREEYAKICRENHFPYNITEAFVPLIIYSPTLTESIQITDTCYQMDIYPTIMHLIGCDDYYWKGFGINLMDSTTINNRPVTVKEAFELSDELIRSNWFENIVH